MSRQTMLGRLFGPNNPPDKEKQSKPDDSPSFEEPASKRARKFIPNWLQKYQWLRYKNELMFCDTCISAKASSNPFTEGCTNFQNSTLVRHQDSKVHINAIKTIQLKSNFTKACGTAENLNDSASKGKLEGYAMQLRTIYTMTKRDLPADVFTDLMHLQCLNGLKCDFYKRPQIIMEFEKCIQEVLSKGLRQQLENSQFLGLMLDETFDISVHKKLAIYVRYLVDGEVTVCFLGNEQITDCTASGIETALINFLVNKGITDENVSKVLGLGTDGASVMTGRLNGLGAKLKRRNVMLTQVHCVAHRLNLAASQAGKDIDFCQRYHQMIHALYRFYIDSSVRYDRLRELQEILVGKATQMTEPTSVRWLSVEAAVKSIFANYSPIYQSLESDESAGKADGLLKFIANAKFLLFTALLIDVLTVIGILSLTFQQDHVNVSHIRQNVSTTKETLGAMKTASETVNMIYTELGNLPEPGTKNRFRDIEVTDNQQVRNDFSHLRDRYISKLVSNLDDRFPDDELHTLECFDLLLNPKRYPDNVTDLANYGTGQLNTLLNQYAAHVELDANRARAHFLHFKHFVRSQAVLPFDRLARLLIVDYSQVYPDFALLAKIALIIPVSSAPCERGFFVQNALKNKVRNRLNPERLNRLMFIKLVGPNIETFDFMQAARLFAHGAEGRL